MAGCAWCVRLSRLLVGFQTHLKSMHFHFNTDVLALILLQVHIAQDVDLDSAMQSLVHLHQHDVIVPSLKTWLHILGVRIYVVCNTCNFHWLML